ncbi:MAG: valine--tRNA ligase [Candidatus Chisholmbacteria bacterium RIFCSPHIGHO2_01_FULL_49_18]|uniref:Valine--tRNA ligase n=2 Tax=Candidatus Chisholmiibacteriota TaxID=1817900 RepID=A0A1G1VN52_9BACT|nr:MAG: valine--tRNA ligase [Candidatus Chisholmbacteria bacterium RIFCSPHIGHO2_01_FULL_49_18]OGY19485.1 MAG: valine--tRNA ligase [Candidatus Chisholmbacteria bacterium RIFCSPLOWO2_01_FULL_49_14]
MEKRYTHSDHEERIYALWEQSGAFAPSQKKGAKPYCIIMPPPNANDPLHIGHAMFVTVEDILIRYQRMRGRACLWLPGADHAGIETQFVFEKKLKKQGKSRMDYDRESLFRMIWDYVQENKGVATEQMKKLGASADWSRFTFTLDENVVRMVLDTFFQLHRDGLVYRDLRLVNFCTHCGTAFSDLEVKHVEQITPLYYMKYGPFTLATVRPETKFGDTAVAVNPKDPRYKQWIGKEVEVKGLLGQFRMRVIADDYVDPEFGTGVVKITPAHDPNDFEVWLRHRDEIPGPKQVIGFDGKLSTPAGKYAGLPVKKGREIVVRDLQAQGLLTKVDEQYRHILGVCYRCRTPIEPLPLPQFFIKVEPLVQKTLQSLQQKQVTVFGAGYGKTLKHWLENLKDWNVSRQIVWGIRMPVWYKIQSQKSKVKSQNNNIFVSFLNRKKNLVTGEVGTLLNDYTLTEIKGGLQSLRAPVDADYIVSPTPPGDHYLQETDTFDTWFSSAQWPAVTLQASRGKTAGKTESTREKQDDFQRFYPTDVMETAYDILIFWVMRMLMMGLYRTGSVPFRTVYLHGLIRDEQGRKMSKSLGNIINPLDVTSIYGADALRMALVIRSTAGQDKSVGEGDVRAMRNLTNKIWNAARFILMKRESTKHEARSTKPNGTSHSQISKADDRFFQQLSKVVDTVTNQLDHFRIGLAAETVYNEFWHWFCDECIERNKKQEISNNALLQGLIVFLKLMHPFVPFITEAAYQQLQEANPKKKRKELHPDLLISSPWPDRSA